MRRSDCWPEPCLSFFAGACHGAEAFGLGLYDMTRRFGAVTKEPARSGWCVVPVALLHNALPAACATPIDFCSVMPALTAENNLRKASDHIAQHSTLPGVTCGHEHDIRAVWVAPTGRRRALTLTKPLFEEDGTSYAACSSWSAVRA